MIAECIGCREQKEIYAKDMCIGCIEWEKNHLEELRKSVLEEKTCTLCGYVGTATDLHHVHGRKNSNETIRICCNCHAEIHRGKNE